MIGTLPLKSADNDYQQFQMEGIQVAIRHLFDALELAADTGRPAWDFAIEIPSLQGLGVTSSQLRWLVCKQFIEHGRETTPVGAIERTFAPTGPLSFTHESCFVINERGLDFARGLKERDFACETLPLPEEQQASNPLPCWNADLGELRFGLQVVKRYKVPSPNQQLVLATFQEEGWPCRVDDPLPPHPELDPKRRLHDTIKSLNRHQIVPVLRFYGDGTGEGVRWGFLQ